MPTDMKSIGVSFPLALLKLIKTMVTTLTLLLTTQ
jgi:hypothetical protein